MIDLHEYPSGHVGTRHYVSVRGYSRSIPRYKTFRGQDGYNYVLPEFGGTEMPCTSGSPFLLPDKMPYISPMDGTAVSSRSTHREHMRKHGVEEAPDMPVQARRDEPDKSIPHDIIRAMRDLGGGNG